MLYHFLQNTVSVTFFYITDLNKLEFENACRKSNSLFAPLQSSQFRKLVKESDVVHFHDMKASFSYLSVLYASIYAKVVITHHDCFGFFALCNNPHFVGDEELFLCPDCSLENFSNLITKPRVLLKRLLSNSSRIHHVFPSKWIKRYALKIRPEWDPRAYIIRNGIELNRFNKRFKKPSESNKFKILLLANGFSSTNKGIAYAIEAIHSVNDLNPTVLVVGSVNENIEKKLLNTGCEVFFKGFVKCSDKVAEFCAEASVLLFPSLVENCPLSVLECMASGTPVIGFKSGGTPELVIQNKNGILVKLGNQKKLNEALRFSIVNLPVVDEWSFNCRKRAEDLFSHTSFTQNHLNLYEKICKNIPLKSAA